MRYKQTYSITLQAATVIALVSIVVALTILPVLWYDWANASRASRSDHKGADSTYLQPRCVVIGGEIAIETPFVYTDNNGVTGLRYDYETVDDITKCRRLNFTT